MKMHDLISWFQLEYPHLVANMRAATHHLTFADKGHAVQSNSGHNHHPASLNPYHLEGNIWEHTLMVCKQVENAPYEVQIAALLHDIGKPDTRAVNPKNGRVSFFNHDAVGAFMTLEILKHPDLKLSKREQINIFNLIALHTQVYKLDNNKLAELGLMGEDFLYDLIELGKCDHAGRFHTEGNAIIPEFKELTIPQRPTDGKEKEVIILCGLPGAGKSTWVDNNLEKYGPITHVSRDDIIMRLGAQNFGAKEFSYKDAWDIVDQKKVDQMLNESLREAKQWGDLGLTAIIDMTHMSKKSRRRSLANFGSDYKKKCVMFLPDLPTLYLQNEKRHGKIIEKSVIERMMRSFYPPTYEQFDEIEYVL